MVNSYQKQVAVKQNDQGVWYVRPYLGRDTFGKPIKPYHSFPYASSREEAQELADLWVNNLTADGLVNSARLVDLLADYIELKRRNGASPNSIKSYELFTCTYVGHYLKNANARDLTVVDFNRFEQQLLMDKDQGGQGLSRNSVLSVHNFLRGAYNYFVDAGICESNPLFYVAKPHPDKSEAASLDEWDFALVDEALNNAIKRGSLDFRSATYAFAAWLVLHTGLRCGEVCALRRRDVNRMNGYIHVGGTVIEERGKEPYRRDVTKGRKCRNVTITKNDIKAIDGFMRLQDETLGRLVADAPLITVHGLYERPTVVSAAFSHLRDRLRLPKRMTFHGLRHTHATWCLANGVDLKTLSERLGHADEATTLRIYAHVLPGRDAQAAEAFERAANQITNKQDSRIWQ